MKPLGKLIFGVLDLRDMGQVGRGTLWVQPIAIGLVDSASMPLK
jgi:hypothetical protein